MPARLQSILGMIAIAALLVAISRQVAAADKITISSTNPTAFDIDYVVAREKGFFAKESLAVEPTYMTPDLVVKALIAGSVDLARSGTHFGLIAAVRGAEIKIIGGTNYGYAYQVIANPQFKTLADLRGQRIAGASLASITTTIFKDVMLRRGIPPSDYTLLFVGGSGERFQAVASGQVAASLAEAPPFNFRSIEAGRRVLLNYGDEIKNLQYASFFALNRSLQQNRQLFSRYMRAIGQAQRWINDPANEQAAIELMVQRLRVDATIAAQTYKFIVQDNKSFRHEALIDGPGLAEMIRLLDYDKLIPKREPWEMFVDPAFIAQAK
ncbi:MAG TPA: ABC transporter substrate-binding protein [Candidatus Limnocylindria bacterium]|nr:ABC transporter substrate-binding protein [Candidatus Limnocylindria bacterium]